MSVQSRGGPDCCPDCDGENVFISRRKDGARMHCDDCEDIVASWEYGGDDGAE